MAINNKKYLLLAIFFFVFSSFLSAQNAGYFVQEKGNEVKYVQRFVWSGEYALKYDVIFEREVNRTYRPYLRETTIEQFIELSLPPGNYRLRVIPYDILGRPAEGSQWVNIQVFAVPQGEQDKEQVVEIRPDNFKPEPERVSELESKEEEEPEKPEKEKTIFFRIGAELGIRSSLYGDKYFGDVNDPYVGLRASIVFKAPLEIYLGPELNVDVNRWGNIEDWKLFFYTFGVNILAEKWSPKKIIGVGFRLGLLYPSIDIMKNWHDIPSSEQREYFKNNYVDIIATEEGVYADRFYPNMGVSFYWLIKKHLLLELSFDYLHLFSLTNDYYPSGYISPFLGISYQF